MAASSRIQYFLGDNSPSGFYSLYSHLLPPEHARARYILKGGPGCGKSTLMRRIGSVMEEQGVKTEYILCSGDPDSLDALILPEKGLALVDGTAPHIVEPTYPGALDHYVNLGDCYDKEALAPLRPAIQACTQEYKGCYARAYRCLGASAAVSEDARAILLTDALQAKLAKRAKGISARELPPKRGAPAGEVTQRFLGAVTHRGSLCLYETALAQCSRVYELADSRGLAHELLVHLLAAAVEGGYNVIACPDPMAPGRLAHLLIPERELAFLSPDHLHGLPIKPYRRLRIDDAADRTVLRANHQRLHFSRKVSLALLEEGVSSLARAKALHDELESIYNPHVDFNLVSSVSNHFISAFSL